MPAMAVAAGEAGDWSYWRVLRSGRLGVLLAGILISSVGNGMIISALPLLALQLRGRLPAGRPSPWCRPRRTSWRPRSPSPWA
jgi:hypothetical protein